MILKALHDYYIRAAAQPDSSIPEEGFEAVEIDYLVYLTADGQFKRFEIQKDILCFVPKGEDRTSNVKPNFIWDKVEYIFGYSPNKEGKESDHQKKFIERIVESANESDISEIKAIAKFLSQDPQAQIQQKSPQEWDALIKTKNAKDLYVNFVISPHSKPVTDLASVQEYWKDLWQAKKQDAAKIRCLVTGFADRALVDSHARIKNFPRGGNAKLISFDNKTYFSFDKQANENAPISMEAAFACETALKYMLRSESKNKRSFNDLTFLFWPSETLQDQKNLEAYAEKAEAITAYLNGYNTAVDGKLNSVDDKKIRPLENLFDASGQTKTFTPDSSSRSRLYSVLGLSAPNSGRLAVRYWRQAPIDEIGSRILQHMQDTAVYQRGRRFEPADWQLMEALTPSEQKNKKTNANLFKGFQILLWRSMLEGTPYSDVFLSRVIDRCCAEQALKDKKTNTLLPNVGPFRAAFVKACLLRKFPELARESGDRFMSWSDAVAAKPDINGLAYAWGGLFAVYEQLQYSVRALEEKPSDEPIELLIDESEQDSEDSAQKQGKSKGMKKPPRGVTFRQRFFSAACRRPRAIYARLRFKAEPYLNKLYRFSRNETDQGKIDKLMKVYYHYKNQIEALQKLIDASPLHLMGGMPAQLNTAAQGFFILGYDHKKEYLFTLKSQKGKGN
jgi:CRISPR-associated protein Csd1